MVYASRGSIVLICAELSDNSNVSNKSSFLDNRGWVIAVKVLIASLIVRPKSTALCHIMNPADWVERELIIHSEPMSDRCCFRQVSLAGRPEAILFERSAPHGIVALERASCNVLKRQTFNSLNEPVPQSTHAAGFSCRRTSFHKDFYSCLRDKVDPLE